MIADQDKKQHVPYYRKPEDLTVEEWQKALRKQFAAGKKFTVNNIGDQPLYSDYEVYNPETKKTYKVSIRDNINSFNYCSCPDFRVNTLGTCKHVEYVLLDKLRYKKYQKLISKAQKNDYSSLSIHYVRDRQVRLKKADHIGEYPLETEFFDKEGFLLPPMTAQLEEFIRGATGMDPDFRIYPDVFERIDRDREERKRLEKLEEIFPDGAKSGIFDDLVKATLYPYQKEGVIGILRAGRVLLADEMGLGKTIQAIAAVEVFARYFGVSRVLIICPTSLKYQWKSEIRKFTEREACIVEGLVHRRKDLYLQQDLYKIISYGVVRNDLHLIKDWEADLVILDEAQRIKNWQTKTAQSVKKINSNYAIVTTGTPLENRISELHSIVEFVDMYKLGPLFRFLDKHQILDEHGKMTGYRNLRSIHKTLDDILIRRTKKEISDQLPGRIDKHFFVEMTPEQTAEHKDYYDVVCQLVNKWISYGFLDEQDQQRLLVCLNCMRMVADSTYILNPKSNHGNKVAEVSDFIRDVMEYDGHKLLIFSQWKRMFELLIRELEKLGHPFVYLNGDVPAEQRKTIIDRFREDDGLRIFLSTDAGGVGVNLQRANILVNLDLPWNPAVLEQRIGRIYRLGQKKKVQVFNFISAYSIEHRILHLLEFKKSVFAGVLDEDGKDQVMMEGFMQSVRDLVNVNLDGKESALPRYIRDQESYNLAAEVNQRYLQDGPGENGEESSPVPADSAGASTGDEDSARRKVPGIEPSTTTARRFIGKLRRLVRAVSSVFGLRR
ncbi:MAG: DEAD/DEAH box helicase [Bacteroidales bacterium]|nr:DEAD/DEAH box helicase [Bacteroidales bacterium]